MNCHRRAKKLILISLVSLFVIFESSCLLKNKSNEIKSHQTKKVNDTLKRSQLICLQKAKMLTIKYPNNLDLIKNLGHVYYRLKLYNNAIQQYKTAIKLSPNDPDIYIHLGIVLYKEKQYSQAIQQFKESIILDSKFKKYHWLPSAYYWLGRSYGAMKNYHYAYNAWKKMSMCKLSNEQKSIAYSDMGDVCFRLNNIRESTYWYKKSLNKNPRKWLPALCIGLNMATDHQYSIAKKYFEIASHNAKSNSEHLRSYFFLGKLAEDMNDPIKALKYYKLSLKYNSHKDTEFYNQALDGINRINAQHKFPFVPI